MNQNNEEFNINKVVAEFISLNIKDLYDIGKDFLKGTKDSIKNKLNLVFSTYLKNISERYGKSKSFFIRDDSQPLNTFYIPVGIKTSKIKINTANLNAIISHNNKSIITGSAGSGKSVLLKYLLIDSLKDKKKVPIFIGVH